MYTYLGNKDLLNRITIGFLASRKLPSNVILPTLDWAVEISNRTIALEKENITRVSERTAHKRNEYIRKSAQSLREIYSL